MAEQPYDNLAAIHFKNLDKKDPSENANPELAGELEKLGVGTVLVPNSDSYHLEDQPTVEAHSVRLHLSKDGRPLLEKGNRHEFALADRKGVNVVRTRVIVPPGALEEIIPVLDGPRLRRISESKWLQYEYFSHFMPNTILLPASRTISDIPLEKLKSNTVVVKGDSSLGAKYVEIVSKEQLPQAIAAIKEKFHAFEEKYGRAKKNQNIVIQELAIGRRWYELKGVDAQNQERIKNADSTELRVYCFADEAHKLSEDQRFFSVVRTWKNGKEEEGWAFIDQDSTPIEVIKIASEVCDKILRKMGVKFGVLAVDFVKAQLSSEKGTRYLIREINTKPAMAQPDQNYNVTLEQRRRLAHLISAAAKSVLEGDIL